MANSTPQSSPVTFIHAPHSVDGYGTTPPSMPANPSPPNTRPGNHPDSASPTLIPAPRSRPERSSTPGGRLPAGRAGRGHDYPGRRRPHAGNLPRGGAGLKHVGGLLAPQA